MKINFKEGFKRITFIICALVSIAGIIASFIYSWEETNKIAFNDIVVIEDAVKINKVEGIEFTQDNIDSFNKFMIDNKAKVIEVMGEDKAEVVEITQKDLDTYNEVMNKDIKLDALEKIKKKTPLQERFNESWNFNNYNFLTETLEVSSKGSYNWKTTTLKEMNIKNKDKGEIKTNNNKSYYVFSALTELAKGILGTGVFVGLIYSVFLALCWIFTGFNKDEEDNLFITLFAF